MFRASAPPAFFSHRFARGQSLRDKTPPLLVLYQRGHKPFLRVDDTLHLVGRERPPPVPIQLFRNLLVTMNDHSALRWPRGGIRDLPRLFVAKFFRQCL